MSRSRDGVKVGSARSDASAAPLRFMNVVGLRMRTGRPATVPSVARALGAREGGKVPMRGDGAGQEKAGIVARRRGFRSRIAQAAAGARGLRRLWGLRRR